MAGGRPQKNNVEFLPLFVRKGNKVGYIDQRYGNDGYATFMRILIKLADTDFHFLDLSKPMHVMLMASDCKIEKDLLFNIIDDLAELGKFEPNLWKECKVIWCQDLVDSLQEAYKKRSNNCMTFDNLCKHLLSLGTHKLSFYQSKVGKNTQSRVDKSKVDNIIKDNINVCEGDLENDGTLFPETKETKPKPEAKEFIPPTFEEVWTYILSRFPDASRDFVYSKFVGWEANDWHDLSDKKKKILNWKSKFATAMGYVKTEPKPTQKKDKKTDNGKIKANISI